MNKLTPAMNVIFRFARAELSVKEFEAWVYGHDSLEELLGPVLFLEMASTNFSKSDDVNQITNSLIAWCEHQIKNRCLCRAMRDNDKKTIGPQEWLFTTTFSTIRRRTPWIRLDKCNDCGDNWLIGTDVTYDDEAFFWRIAEQTALDIRHNGNWVVHPADRDAFWPTLGWVKSNGYSSLEDWQSVNESRTEPAISEGHRFHCYNNRKEIEASEICGCVGCMNTFDRSEVRSWTDSVLEIERTALCPFCAKTSVIGNEAGATLNPGSLTQLHRQWQV